MEDAFNSLLTDYIFDKDGQLASFDQSRYQRHCDDQEKLYREAYNSWQSRLGDVLLPPLEKGRLLHESDAFHYLWQDFHTVTHRERPAINPLVYEILRPPPTPWPNAN
jgi:hypothetical protein